MNAAKVYIKPVQLAVFVVASNLRCGDSLGCASEIPYSLVYKPTLHYKTPHLYKTSPLIGFHIQGSMSYKTHKLKGF